MGRQGAFFLMVLEPGRPPPTLVVLTFTLEGEPKIDTTALAGGPDSTGVEWL